MSCQASHARTKGLKCRTLGVALMEWIVAMALSVLLTWGSAKVFIHAKMAQDAQEAQRQLRACVLAFEAWAWNARHYPLDEAHGGAHRASLPRQQRARPLAMGQRRWRAFHRLAHRGSALGHGRGFGLHRLGHQSRSCSVGSGSLRASLSALDATNPRESGPRLLRQFG